MGVAPACSAERTALSLAAIATRFALFAADFSATPWLAHASLLSRREPNVRVASECALVQRRGALPADVTSCIGEVALMIDPFDGTGFGPPSAILFWSESPFLV